MKETGLKIRQFGDSGLIKRVRSVKKITDYHRRLLSQMAQLMYEVSGIGLAGPQVGVNESLIVVDIGTGLYKLVNPKIIKQEGEQEMEEGCLSVKDVGVKVKRAKKVTVQAEDENGKSVLIEASDLLACVFQHEIDHLNGILIVDHAPLSERAMIQEKLKNLQKTD